MTSYEIYIFFLCLIVFILLAGFSAICISVIYKMTLRLIRSGQEDKKLIEEDNKEKQKKENKFLKVLEHTVTAFLLALFVFAFSSSLYVSCTQDVYFENTPTYRVVNTGSMAKVHPKNAYLNDLGITDRIQTFDLIATYKLPKEEDLRLYDIVVYEMDEILIVHRIVGIEPPNEEHPDHCYFLLQGDAVEAPDRFPVLYSQMRGIYRGERIPFVGSFVLFMQSPAGWLCMSLVVGAAIIAPLMERSLKKEKQKRLMLLRGDK